MTVTPFQFVTKSKSMEPHTLIAQLQRLCGTACPPTGECAAFEHSKAICDGSSDLSPLETFKGKALVLIILAQTTDAIRATVLRQFKLVEAAGFAIRQGRQLEMEKAWHAEGNQCNSRSNELSEALSHFTKTLRNSRENLRSTVRRNLDEFQGEINEYVSSEFVADDRNTIWNLSDRMVNGLKQQAMEFSDRVFPMLDDFCQTTTRQASNVIGSNLPVPVKMQFSGQFGKLTLVEDNVFDKIMGLNSALRVGDMNMDVMGFGTLGKWLSVGKAPQYVREQHVRKNSTQVRNFSRQFTSDLFHEITVNLERFERYILSSLDIALKCNSSMLRFYASKSFRSASSPRRLDFQAIASLGAKRFEDLIHQLDAIRAQANSCYRALLSQLNSEG